MTIDFLSRMIGTVIFALIGARLGVESSTTLGLPSDITAAIFALVGAIGGGYASLVVFLVLLAISTWIHIRVRRSGEKAGLVGAGIP